MLFIGKPKGRSRKIKDDRPLLRANASLLSGLMRRLPPFCARGKDIRSS